MIFSHSKRQPHGACIHSNSLTSTNQYYPRRRLTRTYTTVWQCASDQSAFITAIERMRRGYSFRAHCNVYTAANSPQHTTAMAARRHWLTGRAGWCSAAALVSTGQPEQLWCDVLGTCVLTTKNSCTALKCTMTKLPSAKPTLNINGPHCHSTTAAHENDLKQYYDVTHITLWSPFCNIVIPVDSQ